jgi:histidine triad (HIT) family protein
MIGVRQTARAIDVAYQRPGIAVWQNNGVAASQTINHVHFHVAGTLDAGGTDWGEVDELTVDQTELIRDKVDPYLAP